MASFIIKGGKKLQGEVKISGSKNASLPIMAGSILNKGITKLYNVPNIKDIQVMIEILEVLGCKIKRNSGKIIIDSRKINNSNVIPEELMCKMRSSVILAGALLARNKEACFTYPGGCDIGARPIDLHLEGFKKIGITIEEKSGYIKCFTDSIIGNEIALDFPSVGATENIILASIFCEEKTIIKNSAREPEIVDLQNFLNRMGAKISGAGESTIIIEGVKELKKEVSYTVMPDRIEAGTFLCIAAATNSKIKLTNVNQKHLSSIIYKLEEMGCILNVDKKSIYIEGPKKLKAQDITTMPYPGFPTDMQSIFGAILTISKGTSIIVENIFESRYKYTNELIKMGAKIKIEGRTAIIKGIRKLSGTKIKSTDLRGGAALVVAGLITKGKTRVENIEYILRGYENLEKKLQKLGANIIIEEGD